MGQKAILWISALLGASSGFSSCRTVEFPANDCMCSSWVLTFSNHVGYRRDRQEFVNKSKNSRFNFTDGNTLFYDASLAFSWERLFIRFGGDYGWLVDGKLSYGKNEPASFAHMGGGYSADANVAIGCRVKFWDFCNGSFSFVPALGYGYSHFKLFPEGNCGKTLFTRPVQQDWFGPTLEGRISFAWQGSWRVDLIYQYNPVDFRQKFSEDTSRTTYDSAGNFQQAQSFRQTISTHSDSTRTQLGGIDISYVSCRHWQIGSRFLGSSTWSHTGRSIIHGKNESFSPTYQKHTVQRFSSSSIEWVRYAVSLYSSYWF